MKVISATPRLTAVLKDRGLTQQQLSVLTGIPQGTISRFDRTTRHEDAHVASILGALNIGYYDLFNVVTSG